MAQKTQTRRNRSGREMFSMILKQIRVFAWKAMSTLVIWLKGNMRKALAFLQVVMPFEHSTNTLQVVFRFRSDHVLGSLISPLGNQSDEQTWSPSHRHRIETIRAEPKLK